MVSTLPETSASVMPLPSPLLPPAEAPGRIGIELPTGVRLSVDAAVDADALGRVLAVLAR